MGVRLAVALCALGAVFAGAVAVERGAAAASAGPAAATIAGPEQRTGDVIVKFRRSITLGDLATALDDAQGDAEASTAGSGLVLVAPQPGQSVDDVIASLRTRGDVEFAEPDHVVSIAATPTDPLYATYQWSLPQIGLPTAWNTTTGSASVIVAVVDTGVDATHPDLAGKITTGANAGFNFVSNNTNTADDHFHGTFVSSIIAMNTNNAQGGAGVCWACMIMPVKVLDSNGSGSTFNVAQGIDWAVAHGAKVINLSLGSSAPDSGLQTSIDNAWNAGVIVVAASGNSGGAVMYPAAYPNAIAVGSNNSSGVKSTFSSFGPELDVMAPGEGVFGALCTCSTYTGGYGTGSGTSFSSPHVAGVVGLMISAGITDKNQIRSRLTSTATDMDVAGFDNNTGWGRVNAAAAIGARPADRDGDAARTRRHRRPRRRRARTRRCPDRDGDAHEHAYTNADAHEHAGAADRDTDAHEHADSDADADKHAGAADRDVYQTVWSGNRPHPYPVRALDLALHLGRSGSTQAHYFCDGANGEEFQPHPYPADPYPG